MLCALSTMIKVPKEGR